VYRCGTYDVEDKDPKAYYKGKPKLGFEVRRQVSLTPVAKVPTPAKGQKRPAAEDYYPMVEWKRRFVEGSNACCKPWVSFASATSLLVTWLPPTFGGSQTVSKRFAEYTYTVEFRECPDPAKGKEDTVGPWQALSEPHSGTAPSHWAQGFTTGSWVQFQVKANECEALAKTSFSEPSDPFHVGFADFTCCPEASGALPPRGFSAAELDFFMALDTPAKVQDFLDTIPMNHEVQDETNFSALETLRQNHGHCVEGAMLGAYILSLHGHPPYMMDMNAHEDDSHNIIPFRVDGKWGCLSVSNHSSLRYRNPVYRNIRELMMSFFDDYMNGQGQRSLHCYTMPMNLAVVFGPRWATQRGETWEFSLFGDQMTPYEIVKVKDLKHVRAADDMMKASTVLQREWRCPDNFDEEAARRNENK
jgi:hypothetical protein